MISRESALVLFSDGLYEAADLRQVPYGFDRPAEMVRRTIRRPADSIIKAIIEDWRRHLGGQEISDDTTIVVIRRLLQ